MARVGLAPLAAGETEFLIAPPSAYAPDTMLW
jgi:hypothetical protein